MKEKDGGILNLVPEKILLSVPQLQVVEQYYSTCAQIDRHNRCRQDSLNLEKKVETKDWSFRFNTSLLGICVVDGWLLYRGVQGYRPHLTQRAFYETLAAELIDSLYSRCGLRPRPEVAGFEPIVDRLPSGIGIHLSPTRQKRKALNGEILPFALQKKCRLCKAKKTTHICSGCKDCDGAMVWVCHTSTGRSCFLRLRQIHNF